jgi:hypothetical protein
MTELLKAVKFRNLDEAKQVLGQLVSPAPDIFDDGGEEPEGLLSIIPEDRIGEEDFLKLFDLGKGVLVEVERIHYSGLGPPADERDYMGFAHERLAYVLKGRRLPIEIEDCSFGAVDFHHLDLLVLDGDHPIDVDKVGTHFGLAPDWTFDDLFELIRDGAATAQEIDKVIHLNIH